MCIHGNAILGYLYESLYLIYKIILAFFVIISISSTRRRRPKDNFTIKSVTTYLRFDKLFSLIKIPQNSLYLRKAPFKFKLFQGIKQFPDVIKYKKAGRKKYPINPLSTANVFPTWASTSKLYSQNLFTFLLSTSGLIQNP